MRPASLLTASLLTTSLFGASLLGLCGPAMAQAPSAAPAAGSAPAIAAAAPAAGSAPAIAAAAPADPVIAKVNGQSIYLSELALAARGLPEQARSMPTQMLYPLLLDRLVDRKALAIDARKQGLDKDPLVKRQVDDAIDTALQNALISRDVGPEITEAAIKAVYDKDYAGKPGEEEVHARHILVPTEDAAKKIIAQLKTGTDFATLAKEKSTEPGAAQSGGDLGWFKKSDMVPEFADAAFALKPGTYSQTPVHTQFGWHVIKVEGRRTAAAPTLAQVQDQIRQKLIEEGIQKVLKQARAGVQIEKFNPDGSPQRATDLAEPPGQPAAAPAH